MDSVDGSIPCFCVVVSAGPSPKASPWSSVTVPTVPCVSLDKRHGMPLRGLGSQDGPLFSSGRAFAIGSETEYIRPCNRRRKRHRHFSIWSTESRIRRRGGLFPLRKFGLSLDEDLISGATVTSVILFDGSEPSWKGKHVFVATKEDGSITALRRSLSGSSPSSSPVSTPTVPAIATQLVVARGMAHAHTRDQQRYLGTLRALLWERLD